MHGRRALLQSTLQLTLAGALEAQPQTLADQLLDLVQRRRHQLLSPNAPG